MNAKRKVLIVIGPTATGKTDLALSLAKRFNGELVACDSRQVYKGLDIGTGKEPSQDLRFKKYDLRWEVDGVNIWMYDVVDPKTQYSAHDYVAQSTIIIKQLLKEGKLPIIVGGTGLYLRGLLENLENLSIPADPNLRAKLEKLSLAELQKRLKDIDPKKYEGLNNSEKNNPRRLVRQIELLNMYPYSSDIKNQSKKTENWDTLKIGLNAPRLILNERIDQRVDSRVKQGMVEEAKKLVEKGISFTRMRDLGLEYGCLADLLEDRVSIEEMVKKLKIKIHQYAKRQMVWFKKDSEINWFDITQIGFEKKVADLVENWYNVPI